MTGSKTGELLQKTGANWKVNGNHGLWLAMTNLEKKFFTGKRSSEGHENNGITGHVKRLLCRVE